MSNTDHHQDREFDEELGFEEPNTPITSTTNTTSAPFSIDLSAPEKIVIIIVTLLIVLSIAVYVLLCFLILFLGVENTKLLNITITLGVTWSNILIASFWTYAVVLCAGLAFIRFKPELLHPRALQLDTNQVGLALMTLGAVLGVKVINGWLVGYLRSLL